MTSIPYKSIAVGIYAVLFTVVVSAGMEFSPEFLTAPPYIRVGLFASLVGMAYALWIVGDLFIFLVRAYLAYWKGGDRHVRVE